MPASITPGYYRFEFGLAFPESNAGVPPPKPLYLTSSGEGKQLTIEPHDTSGKLLQEVN
jgi:hypothetical protein